MIIIGGLSEKRYDVLVAMGGSDVANLTQFIAHTCPPHWRVALLATTSNAHLKELQNYVLDKPHLFLHVNSKEVAKLLHQSRLAIITPSSIVHEVLFMNIPFIAIKVASNQDDMYDYLKENHVPLMSSFEPQQMLSLVHTLLQKDEG